MKIKYSLGLATLLLLSREDAFGSNSSIIHPFDEIVEAGYSVREPEDSSDIDAPYDHIAMKYGFSNVIPIAALATVISITWKTNKNPFSKKKVTASSYAPVALACSISTLFLILFTAIVISDRYATYFVNGDSTPARMLFFMLPLAVLIGYMLPIIPDHKRINGWWLPVLDILFCATWFLLAAEGLFYFLKIWTPISLDLILNEGYRFAGNAFLLATCLIPITRILLCYLPSNKKTSRVKSSKISA